MLPVTLRGDLAILLAALLLDAVLGDPPALWRRVPHPVVLIGWVISRLDHRLNRDGCSRRDLRWRGALVALGLAAAALGLGAAVTALRLHWRWGWILELLLTWTLLAQNSLFQHVRAVAVALRQGGLAGGRWAVSRIVGRDPNSLDSHGVARAAIESSAENFADGVVAPALWYILAGFPGILLYKTVNTADSMIGHLTPRHRDFGMASARLDDLLNLLPARLAAALLALAMLFVPTARPWQAWRVMWRDHGHHRSPNAGWPESAMAGGLDLALAGPRRYVGHNVDDPWIGDGRARATVADIHRALACLVVGCLLLFGLVLLLLLLPALLRSGGLPW